MKALTTLLTAVMLGAMSALPVAAQSQQHSAHHGAVQADSTRGVMPCGMMGMMQGDMMNMMHGGMMQGNAMNMMQGGMMQMHSQMMGQMMQNPLHRSPMMVRVLPTLQEPLDLSDDQVVQLKERAGRFAEQKQVHQEQVVDIRQQLKDLFASGAAAPDQVRQLLEEAARHGAQMQALAYETALEMKDMLTDEQRTRLSEMTPMELHQRMMSNFTMMEMMQMMQAMHGAMLCDAMTGTMQGMMKVTPGMMGTMNRP